MSGRSEETNQEQSVVDKNGVKMLGYVVPYWVIALVVLLVLYVLYDRGYLKSLVGAPATHVISLPETGSGASVLLQETPEQVRALFGGSINSYYR